METLNCKKWLVRGNHDTKSDAWYLSHGWDFVSDKIYLNKFGMNILLTHIPTEMSEHDINIHGHLHNSNHRRMDEYINILTSNHILISLEKSNCLPINLESMIKKFNKKL